jgi:anti-anti-sigma factor
MESHHDAAEEDPLVAGAELPPLLRISVERSGETAVIRLDGELDCSTAEQMDAALTHVLNDPTPPQRILVDADRLAFADVSGLTPLIRAAHRVPPGGHLQLRNARRQVIRVIRMLDLADELGLDC